MEVNGNQSVENLHTSTSIPSRGTIEVAPNHGGGGLEVLGQAVESTTTTPKSVPEEVAPALAPAAMDGSSAGKGEANTYPGV